MDDAPAPRSQIGPAAAIAILVVIFLLGGYYFFTEQHKRFNTPPVRETINT
jgi:hypothetical protein